MSVIGVRTLREGRYRLVEKRGVGRRGWEGYEEVHGERVERRGGDGKGGGGWGLFYGACRGEREGENKDIG